MLVATFGAALVIPPTANLVASREAVEFRRPGDFCGNDDALRLAGHGWPKRGIGRRIKVGGVRIENPGLEIALGPEIHLGHGGPLADWPVVDVVAHKVARLPGAKGQIDEIARVGEKLVAEREAADCGLEPVVEPFLIPGELLKAEDVAAPVDFVEQLQRRDARVGRGVPAPAIDKRDQEPRALEP